MKGFTLLELTVTTALLVVLAAAFFPLYTGFQTLDTAGAVRYELLQNIKLAHQQALAGLNNSNHGVYFSGSTYTVYQGTSYAARTPGQDLVFTLPNHFALSGLGEINFAKKTGLPSVTGTVTITNSATNDTASVTVNSVGLIQ